MVILMNEEYVHGIIICYEWVVPVKNWDALHFRKKVKEEKSYDRHEQLSEKRSRAALGKKEESPSMQRQEPERSKDLRENWTKKRLTFRSALGKSVHVHGIINAKTY